MCRIRHGDVPLVCFVPVFDAIKNNTSKPAEADLKYVLADQEVRVPAPKTHTNPTTHVSANK